MAFVTLEDLEGTFELVVFPKLFADVRFLLVENKVLLIAGHVSLRDDQDPNIIADQIVELKPDQMILPPNMQSFLSRVNPNSDMVKLNNNGQTNESINLNFFTTEEKNNADSINGQLEVQTSADSLKLGIKWEQELDTKTTKVLVSMLDYFSGETPVYLFNSKNELIKNLDQPKYFDLNYLEQLTERYSIEKFLII